MAAKVSRDRYHDRGLACVLLKCDKPSHPDWGRLGVVRATSVDNRWHIVFVGLMSHWLCIMDIDGWFIIDTVVSRPKKGDEHNWSTLL